MHPSVTPFVPGPQVRIEGRSGGPLAGLTFAAKDLFDVAGHPTGGGNHDWASWNPVPNKHAWAVQKLLDAGATLIGKTITDEVSLGILGENAFDGTPINPKALDRVPGGSSSGSASAVASGLCDTALGTDTGGSVRVPASFCGIYGIRPTHGRLPLAGMLPQAPSSDTTGWFARDAATFARVSQVMLGETLPTELPKTLIVAVDAFGFADDDVQAALKPMVSRLAYLIGQVREECMSPPGLSVWARAMQADPSVGDRFRLRVEGESHEEVTMTKVIPMNADGPLLTISENKVTLEELQRVLASIFIECEREQDRLHVVDGLDDPCFVSIDHERTFVLFISNIEHKGPKP